MFSIKQKNNNLDNTIDLEFSNKPEKELLKIYNLANTYLSEEKYKSAYENYKIILEVCPDHSYTLLNAAKSLTHLNRFFEARELLERLIKISPSKEAYKILANIQQCSLDYASAIKTYEKLVKLDPENPEFYLNLGRVYGESYTDYKKIFMSLEKSIELTRNQNLKNNELEVNIADTYRINGHFNKAIEIYDRINLKQKRDEPILLIYYGICLRALNKEKEACEKFKKALITCKQLILNSKPVDTHILYIISAWINFLLGDVEEASRIYSIIGNAISPKELLYSGQDTYLDNSFSRIEKMRRIIRGRDIVILLYGPSIKYFNNNIKEFLKKDACFVSVNKFDEVEENILIPHGRELDIVVTTNPSDLNKRWHSYQQYLERPEENLLVSSKYAFLGLQGKDIREENIVEEYNDKLLYVNPQIFLPSITTPLHFLPGNTLSVALPVLSLGLPNRIFIFGADGGGSSNHDNIYFFDRNINKNDEYDRKKEGMRRLKNDAFFFDQIVGIQMLGISKLYNIPIPEVFNCCPNSGYNFFQKINYKTALSKL